MSLDKFDRIILMIGITSASALLGDWLYQRSLESMPPSIKWTPNSVLNDAGRQISTAMHTSERHPVSA